MRKFHTFELALLLALAAALLWGAWSLHRQDDLQQKMIRLHVIANSDSDADQALKLHVRDAVLRRAEDILRQSADMTEARARLRDSLPDIGDAAAQELAAQGSGYSVSVSLEETEFPLKTYDGFALPAGEYMALRVVIGAGEGRGVSAFVYRCRLRAGGDGAQQRPDGGRCVPDDRRRHRLRPTLPFAGAVGAPAPMAGQMTDTAQESDNAARRPLHFIPVIL